MAKHKYPRLTRAVGKNALLVAGFLVVNQFEGSDLYAGCLPIEMDDIDAAVAWLTGQARRAHDYYARPDEETTT